MNRETKLMFWFDIQWISRKLNTYTLWQKDFGNDLRFGTYHYYIHLSHTTFWNHYLWNTLILVHVQFIWKSWMVIRRMEQGLIQNAWKTSFLYFISFSMGTMENFVEQTHVPDPKGQSTNKKKENLFYFPENFKI